MMDKDNSGNSHDYNNLDDDALYACSDMFAELSHMAR